MYKALVRSKERGINMQGWSLENSIPSDYVMTYSQVDSDRLSASIQSFITKHLRFLEVCSMSY